MALLDHKFKNRSDYQECDEEQKTLSVWYFVIYLFMCFTFGFCCFVFAFWRASSELIWPHQDNKLGSDNEFPPEFLIGCSSSSYQIEGAWNADGKGENIWDHLVHRKPNFVKDNGTGDVACDSYNQYKEDVQLIKEIGFTHYRFSISWSRVLPTGHDNFINQPGLTYYHNLVDQLLENDIEPMVKWWITINEPRNIIRGYSPSTMEMNFVAPMIYQPGVADYLAAHTLIRAHAKAYRLYDTQFRSSQNGKISITLACSHYESRTESWEDKMATIRASEFEIGLFAHPIFSKYGDYPNIVKERVDYNSAMEGRTTSRLPKFSEDEVKQIRGSFDFLGMDHYTSFLVSAGEEGDSPSFMRDAGIVLSFDPSWPGAQSPWLKVVPRGMRGILNYIKDKYHNIPVFITENGYSSNSGLNDFDRIQYYHDYMKQMLLAMYQDGCNVIGYTAWSILDNFEWGNGYTEKFGLYYVNFTHPERPRQKKMSADYFKKLIQSRRLLETM